MRDNENARPGDDDQDGRQSGWRAASSVSDVHRSRRRGKLHKRFRTARRISAALDAKCGVERPEIEIDYRATGLDLGWPQRVAAGRALFQRERSA